MQVYDKTFEQAEAEAIALQEFAENAALIIDQDQDDISFPETPNRQQ